MSRLRANFVKPWLPTSHRNFFIIYAATTIYHVWCGLNALLGPGRWFEIDSLKFVNEVADPVIWGVFNLLIAAALYINLHLRDFRFARVALGVGLAWVMLRFLLIALGWATGEDIANSLPNLFLCGAVHVAQTLEPPVNPATLGRRNGTSTGIS